jgi:hypothetical protein
MAVEIGPVYRPRVCGGDIQVAVKLDPIRTSKRLGRERELMELNGVGGETRRKPLSCTAWMVPMACRSHWGGGMSLRSYARWACPTSLVYHISGPLS